ncbi:MAG: copper transporter [Actinomycetota bacterium]
MISFRYHLVTIVAVFLALGLGVLAGTTVLDEGLVNRLERQTQVLADGNATLRERIDAQADELAATESFAEQAFVALAPAKLADHDAVVLTHDLVDATAVDRASEALEVGGASVEAVFTLQSRMSLRDDDARAEMATLLGEPANTDAAALRAKALERLAERLAFGPGRPQANRVQEDILTRLLSAGFVTVDGPGAGETLAQVGGPETIATVVGGGPEEAAAASEVLVPLVGDLRLERMQTAAGQPAGSEVPFVAEVREPGTVASTELVTVDGIDRPIGQLALVLGMQRLGSVVAEGGSYGPGPDASEVIPPLRPGG